MEAYQQNELKPSGIEWLGDIPKHWEVKKLKYVVRVNPEVLPESTDDDLVLDYIDIGSVDSDGNVITRTSYTFDKAPSRARRIVRQGDTIVSTVRTYLKAIAFIESDKENLICSTGFAVLRSISKEVYNKFFFRFCRSKCFLDRIAALSKGVSYPAVDSEDVKNIGCGRDFR
jgi:Type I restriction modification DNA specificity domain.